MAFDTAAKLRVQAVQSAEDPLHHQHHRLCVDLAFISCIVGKFVPGEYQHDVSRIVYGTIADHCLFLYDRMRDAVLLNGGIAFIAERGEQYRQESRVIAQHHARQLAVPAAYGFAYAAVVTCIYLVFANLEFTLVDLYIT